MDFGLCNECEVLLSAVVTFLSRHICITSQDGFAKSGILVVVWSLFAFVSSGII